MRTVVTGASNPFGAAIVQILLDNGHQVRIFGGDADLADKFPAAQWHPGHVATPGSIEPVLAEREVLIHAAGLDALGKDKHANAMHIERSALGARYGAERELLDQLILVAPQDTGRYEQAHRRAIEHVEAARKVPTTIITAADPEDTAKHVLSALDEAPHPGRYPGRENDAVAA